MSPDQLKVLAIPGSLRGDSFNARLLHRLVELAPPELVFIDHFLDGLGDLPHFSQELEGERTPASVEALRRRIAAADALLIATPEYNSAMPGVLKNGLDWASRPSGESVLAAKPAAVLGASPGRFGAVRAQADVRTVLTAIGAEVRAGFECDVRVRFDTDRIQTSVANFQAGEVPSVPVLEVRL